MKKFAIIVALCFALGVMACASSANAQMVFGVKPGTHHMQGAYFGFKAGESVVLSFGLDYAMLGVDVSTDYQGMSVSEEVSANMFAPLIGVKFLFKPEAEGTVSPFLFADIFKAFTSVDMGEMGESETEDMINDLLSPFGFKLGFGAQYAISDKFSVGGEYGLIYMTSSGKIEEDSSEMEISTNLGLTYAAVSLIFVL